MNLIISAEDFQELQFHRDNRLLTDLFQTAREIVESGGKVIVQMEFENAEPDVIRIFSSLAELDEWEKSINEYIKRLEQENNTNE